MMEVGSAEQQVQRLAWPAGFVDCGLDLDLIVDWIWLADAHTTTTETETEHACVDCVFTTYVYETDLKASSTIEES